MTYVNNGYQKVCSHLSPMKCENYNDIFHQQIGIITPGMIWSLYTCFEQKFRADPREVAFTFVLGFESFDASLRAGS